EWFRCPGCLSRRAVLFSVGGVFRCRACHDQAYTSTREDETERANRRIVALQRKLKAALGCHLFHVPAKPKGMHWRTFERLVSQLLTEHHRRDALYEAGLIALLRRTDTLLAWSERIPSACENDRNPHALLVALWAVGTSKDRTPYAMRDTP
ncbi:MAG TPA: hypothetical protein VGR22_04020, partial [Thermomicrobiales bacterium]|nr:hypothetical protein [Thermomicrobiales bacterium]